MPFLCHSVGLRRGAAIAFCLLLSSGSVQAKATYVTFDVYRALAVNSGNTVTGYNGASGFVRTADGNIATFDVPGAIWTRASAVNDNGVISGIYLTSDNGPAHGFVRAADGSITSFDPSGSADTQVDKINNAGVITGHFQDNSGVGHAFVRAPDGTFTVFDIPGQLWFLNVSINDNGLIAGSYEAENGSHGFLRNPDGAVVGFDIPGADQTTITGINSNGDILGTFGYWDYPYVPNTFIRKSNGKITTFFDPDCHWTDDKGLEINGTTPVGINNKGEVAGYCLLPIFNGGHTHWHTVGFVRKPGGALREFKAPNSYHDTDVVGITDAGVIAGEAGHSGYLRFP